MKKLIALLLAMIMVCGLATTAFANGDVLPELGVGPMPAGENGGENDGEGEGTTCTCEEATVEYDCPDHGCVKVTEADCENLDCEFHHPADEKEDASINKYYDILGGEAPAETFDFTLTFKEFTSNEGDTVTTAPTGAPTVTVGDAVFANNLNADTTAPVSVAVTNFDAAPLGVYKYEIAEVASNTAGVNYNTVKVFLNVTILRHEDDSQHYVAAIHYETESGDKVGYLKNEYEAGQLTVSKTISGNMANMSETFEFEVVFTPENSAYLSDTVTVFKDNQVVSVNNYERIVNSDGTITVKFTLGRDGSVVITNIPDGTTYTVKELDLKGYDQTSATGEIVGEAVDGIKPVSGTIKNGDTDTATFNNDRTEGVDTGVALDSAPYIVMLVVAMVGMVALVAKKRYEV